MDYPQYNSYHSSRLEWLDVIPKDWDITRLRLISSRYAGGTPSKDNPEYWQEGTIPWLNSGAVNQGTITEPSEYITELGFKESSVKWIPKDAIIIALAGQGKTKGTAAYTTFETTCNQSMGVIVFEKDHPRYMYWWLVSQYKNIRGMASDDARDGLNLEMIGTIPCPLPSTEEQQKIAAFLDYKTQQIDQLIEKKKALIEKLEEKRIAVITQAVTKGLNKNAKLKPSGVDWLGEVPEHWKITKLRWFINIGSGDYRENLSMEASSTDVASTPVVGGNGIMAYTTEANTTKNALVIGRVGAHCGNVHLIRDESWVTDNALRVHVIDSFDQDYLYWLLKTLRLNDDANKNAQPLITGETVKIRIVPIPTIEEQRSIVKHIEQELSRLFPLSGSAQATIEKLEEYRSALITSAVTGKIDVRGIEVPKEVI